jgi:hypothetical protein
LLKKLLSEYKYSLLLTQDFPDKKKQKKAQKKTPAMRRLLISVFTVIFKLRFSQTPLPLPPGKATQ